MIFPLPGEIEEQAGSPNLESPPSATIQSQATFKDPVCGETSESGSYTKEVDSSKTLKRQSLRDYTHEKTGRTRTIHPDPSHPPRNTSTLNATARPFIPRKPPQPIPTLNQLINILTAATPVITSTTQTPHHHAEKAEAEQRYISGARAGNRARIDALKRLLEDEQLGRGSNSYDVNVRLAGEIEEAEHLQGQLGRRFEALGEVLEATYVAIAMGGEEVDLAWGHAGGER